MGRVGTSGLTPPGSIGAGLEGLFYRYSNVVNLKAVHAIFTLGTISSVGVKYFPSVWICTRGDLGGGRRGEGRLAISGVWVETSSWESELFSFSSFSIVIRRRICLRFAR